MSSSSKPKSKSKGQKTVTISQKKQQHTESEKDIDSSNEDDNDEEQDVIETEGSIDELTTFASLGVVPTLCEAIKNLGWTAPTEIQQKSIPYALAGRDIIGLAETGSGKTGAFSIPVLQSLLANPQRLYAVILAPTRELAFQINEVFEALGSSIHLHCTCIVGGIDMITQAIALAKRPHIIVATPGRLVDHLQNTKGFNLRSLKYLILDEADRMLSMDFEKEIAQILEVIPRDRKTYLFSATMTTKVAKLQKASLQDPIKVEVSTKFQTPKTLIQQYLFIPAKWKDCYLAYILDEFQGQSVIIFVGTCNNALRLALLLRNLGFKAVCLHGQLSQPNRLGALNKFKAGARNILVATDVASRGLDIPNVDLVINFDIPSNGKDYVHRVGRTARAGKTGRSIAMVTQYDVEAYQRLEALIQQKLPAFPCEEETVLVLLERVNEAQRLAARELRETQQAQGENGGGRNGKKNKRNNGGDEEDGNYGEEEYVSKQKRRNNVKNGGGSGGDNNNNNNNNNGGGGGGKSNNSRGMKTPHNKRRH